MIRYHSLLRKQQTKNVEGYRKKYLTNEMKSDKISFVAAKVADENSRKVQKKVLDE